MEKEIRDHVFTSGEAALNYLIKNLSGKKFFHIGPPRDFDLFKKFEKMKSIILKKVNIFYALDYLMIMIKDLRYYQRSI